MNTIVVKFGGSSVADNEKLKTVANKQYCSSFIGTRKDHR